MKKAARDITLSVCVFSWLIILTASAVCAQNLGNIVSIESESVDLESNMSVEEQQYFDVTLVPSSQIDNDLSFESNWDPSLMIESSSYTLGKTDVIRITVLRHLEVSGDFIINNEGKIQYEFVGDIQLEGLKKDEVKELLTKLLSEYIISPHVTVQIIGFNSKIVYVIGEVRSPGKIFMYGDTITVREALVQAGLPLLTGKVSKSRLITPSDTGKVERKTVNVHKLLYEGDLRENLIMNPGDTLYIPPTIMAKALRVIQPVAAPVKAGGSLGRRAYTGGF